MLPAQGTPAHLRRETAGKTLALRAGRQTARSDVRLARVQGEQLSEAQRNAAEKISGRGMAVETGMVPQRVQTSRLSPSHARIFFLQHSFELRIVVHLERGPVE